MSFNVGTHISISIVKWCKHRKPKHRYKWYRTRKSKTIRVQEALTISPPIALISHYLSRIALLMGRLSSHCHFSHSHLHRFVRIM